MGVAVVVVAGVELVVLVVVAGVDVDVVVISGVAVVTISLPDVVALIVATLSFGDGCAESDKASKPNPATINKANIAYLRPCIIIHPLASVYYLAAIL